MTSGLRRGTGEPFSVHVHSGTDPLSTLARTVEREVFHETFGNDEALLAAEYGPYEAQSLLVLVLDEVRDEPAGMMRIVLDGPHGLKSLEDITREPWNAHLEQTLGETGIELDPRKALDVATIAVRSGYRKDATGGLVSLALYQALCRVREHLQAEWFVAVLDLHVLDLLQRTFHQPFSHYRGVGPKRYLDSPASVPVWCRTEAWMLQFAAADPHMHSIVVEGEGLEPVINAPDWEEALRDALRQRR